MKRKKRNRRVLWWSLLVLVLVPYGLYWMMEASTPDRIPSKTQWTAGPASKGALELTWENYADDVRKAASNFNLPPEYLLALITLECSGRKPAGSRYEPGVYRRLKAVQNGDARKYEQVRTKHLKDASDDAVTNLATSWGPFQLMGYKCIGMDVRIHDLRGDSAVWHAVRWMDEEYGKHLRKGHFKDAFHIHNTGRKYPVVGGPRTHDPKYVDKGLERMKWFLEKLEE